LLPSPSRPIQNDEYAVELEQLTAGCTQLDETLVNVLPVAAYPAQFELVLCAIRPSGPTTRWLPTGAWRIEGAALATAGAVARADMTAALTAVAAVKRLVADMLLLLAGLAVQA
jgi:hypothetical protein